MDWFIAAVVVVGGIAGVVYVLYRMYTKGGL